MRQGYGPNSKPFRKPEDYSKILVGILRSTLRADIKRSCDYCRRKAGSENATRVPGSLWQGPKTWPGTRSNHKHDAAPILESGIAESRPTTYTHIPLNSNLLNHLILHRTLSSATLTTHTFRHGCWCSNSLHAGPEGAD